MQNPWVIKTTPISKFATTLSFSGPNSQVSLCYFVYPAQRLRSKLLLLILKKKKKTPLTCFQLFKKIFILFYSILFNLLQYIYIYLFIYLYIKFQPLSDPNGFLKKRMLMFNLTYLKQKKFEFLHATTKTEQRQQIPPQSKSITKKNLISKNIKHKIVAFLCVLWCCLQKQPQQLCFAFISVFIFLSLQGLFLSLSLSFSTANNLNLFKSLSSPRNSRFLFLFLCFIFTTLLWILLAKCGALVFFYFYGFLKIF